MPGNEHYNLDGTTCISLIVLGHVQMQVVHPLGIYEEITEFSPMMKAVVPVGSVLDFHQCRKVLLHLGHVQVQVVNQDSPSQSRFFHTSAVYTTLSGLILLMICTRKTNVDILFE